MAMSDPDALTSSTSVIPLALCKATEKGNLEAVRLFLKNNPEWITAKNQDGKTLLHYAAKASFKIVKYLITRGANINAQDNSGNTPLHHALDEGVMMIPSIIHCLIEFGADVNIKNNVGQTPFHLAEHYDPQGIAKTLIRYGADDSIGRAAIELPIPTINTCDNIRPQDMDSGELYREMRTAQSLEDKLKYYNLYKNRFPDSPLSSTKKIWAGIPEEYW